MKKFVLGILSVSFLLAGCSKYQRVLKSNNPEEKFAAGEKYFNKKDYFRALPLFEELISIYKGTAKAEKTYYYYTYCNFYLGDYETAAYDFENFATYYPNSVYAEECAYMHAYCYYEMSPISSLDQSSTVKGINEFQLFINRYPASAKIPECNQFMDALRLKLEVKSFNNSKLYYDTGDYKAAATALKNMLKDFPSTHFKEEAMYLVVDSYYKYAENSIESKKAERYNLAITSYNEFVAAFPESKFLKDAQKVADDSKKQLQKLSS